DFARHVMAQFVEGDVKPITDSMMFKLYDRTRSYLQPEQVDRSLGDIFIGVDWGGGGKTIVWVTQFVADKMIILNVERVETSDLDRQVNIVQSHIDAYNPKQVVVDAGGGTYQVQTLESRYANLIRKNSYNIRPERPMPTKKEEKKLRKENRYTIDRTFSLDRVINRLANGNMVIPAATDKDRQISDWIVEDFTNVEVELVKLKSTGQTYRRFFNPIGRPSDALHSCNYNEIAHDISRNTDTWFVSAR
ncbi:MAG: hypothetical protein KC444_09190, partial [Nitrosopumilus sp.]|nr:hypothetical protein [Nitrosopumilus sp.]